MHNWTECVGTLPGNRCSYRNENGFEGENTQEARDADNQEGQAQFYKQATYLK